MNENLFENIKKVTKKIKNLYCLFWDPFFCILESHKFLKFIFESHKFHEFIFETQLKSLKIMHKSFNI